MNPKVYGLLLALIALLAVTIFLAMSSELANASPAEAWGKNGAYAVVMGGFFALLKVLGKK